MHLAGESVALQCVRALLCSQDDVLLALHAVCVCAMQDDRR